MIILGIETSCDETAVSVVEARGGLRDLIFKLLGSAVQSQIEIHKQYGGVFPTLAKREHIKNLPFVYERALVNAKIKESEIEIIAVTVGPGLEPALWTGINFAEDLSKKLNIPIAPTNHMEGHIVSVLFNKTEENSKIKFPAIALLISGGHTELVFLKSWLEKEKIGETQDDAVGEAFDKVARMLGLPYPGGPEISKLAEEARIKNFQLEIRLPRPMIHSKDFNFSFSGLKTAVLYYLRDKKEINKLAVAREFEDAVIETLVSKTKRAIDKYSPKTLIIGGGVIANKALRENFLKLRENYLDLPAQAGMEILIPEKSLTTDNATMIAAAGYIEYLRNKDSGRELKAQGNLDIS
jgi:N6-L-threonylcarbamoyladenine synthase